MSQSNKNMWFIGGISALFFIPFIGGVHLFDWDEINFAEIAREMVVLNDFLRMHINYEVFTEKPPMFFWMQALSMKLFGVNEFTARFPNAICGIVTLMTLYKIGEKLKGSLFGFLWVGAYFGSILSHLYFKSGIIDPWFNFFIFLGIYHLILFTWKKEGEDATLKKSRLTYLLLAGVFTGLGVMVKGPVAYLITGLTLGVYWVLNRFKFFINLWEFTLYTITVLAVTGVWFGVDTLINGPQFFIEFTIRQWTIFSTPDAGHGGFPGYHFIVLLLGCFPASIFLIRSHFKLAQEEDKIMNLKKWMTILFWVVLILFTIVKSKIVHYSSMAYFPLTFLAALVLHQLIEKRIVFAKWMKIMLYTIATIAGTVIVLLPWAGKNVELIKPLFEADKFALQNLNADINWIGYESVAGLFLIIITVLSIRFIDSGKGIKGAYTMFGGIGVFVMMTLILFIGKIEGISQRAAIEFFESKQGCDCYVVTERYKSYADKFYVKPSPENKNPNRLSSEWLKYGNIDKDVYFVAKITGTEELEKIEDIEFIKEKNGYTFWKRNAIE